MKKILLILAFSYCTAIHPMEESTKEIKEENDYDAYTIEQLNKELQIILTQRSNLYASTEWDEIQSKQLQEKQQTIRMLLQIKEDEKKLERAYDFFSVLYPNNPAYNDTKKRIETIKNRLPAGRGDRIIENLKKIKN